MATFLLICLPAAVFSFVGHAARPVISGHVAFLSFVSQVFSAGHVAFLFVCLPGHVAFSIHLSPRSVPAGVQHFYLPGICLPGLSLLVSALFRWPCSVSIHLSPRLVTGGVRPFPLFLFICLPGLPLLVSALFRWPCIISIHFSVRPFPPAMQHFYTAGVRPCPLAMQHFYSCVSQACHWWCPPFSAGHVAFLFFCLPGLSLVCPGLLAMKHLYSFVSQVRHYL